MLITPTSRRGAAVSVGAIGLPIPVLGREITAYVVRQDSRIPPEDVQQRHVVSIRMREHANGLCNVLFTAKHSTQPYTYIQMVRCQLYSKRTKPIRGGHRDAKREIEIGRGKNTHLVSVVCAPRRPWP